MLTPPALRAGGLVTIFGLTNRVDLNGQQGKLRAGNSASGRWAVVLDSGDTVSVRETNLAADYNTDKEWVAARVAKRQRTFEPPTARHDDLLRRLLRTLPAAERRTKEPDPVLLFEPHRVPSASAAQLRVCTFNVLDDCRVQMGMGGIHAVWEVRRINLLRCVLAIDADAFLLQELSMKSLSFLRDTLGHEYSIEAFDAVHGGVGVMYRSQPRRDRQVHLQPAAPPVKRTMHSPAASRKPSGKHNTLMGVALHVPLMVHGLGAAAPFALVLSSAHLACFVNAQMQSSNKHSQRFSEYLGRDLLRMPAQTGGTMVLGGDFNTQTDGKRPRAPQGVPSLYAQLTEPVRRVYDSEDEWSEDDGVDDALRWPPRTTAPLARDLLRESEACDFGGLQRGSTAISALLQNFDGRLQGVRARAANEGWPEGGECTDSGHIDWLLASAPCERGPRLRARRAVVGTEEVVPPLAPQQPALIGAANLPPGGKVFASDHYPLLVDLELMQS